MHRKTVIIILHIINETKLYMLGISNCFCWDLPLHSCGSIPNIFWGLRIKCKDGLSQLNVELVQSSKREGTCMYVHT